MHKWYDPRMFDFLSEDDIKSQVAPHDGSGQAIDCRTGVELADAGFDVRYIGGEDGDQAVDGQDVDHDVVDVDTFCHWLE